jgi:hypothetical protein
MSDDIPFPGSVEARRLGCVCQGLVRFSTIEISRINGNRLDSPEIAHLEQYTEVSSDCRVHGALFGGEQ